MNHNEKGQVLLIVVLIMVIALTVGLAVVSRSIVNVRNTVDEENSQRAFSAAEAGVEQALKAKTNIGTSTFSSNEATIEEVKYTSVEGIEVSLVGGNIVSKNDGADIWLVPHDPITEKPDYNTRWTGNLTIYWNSGGSDCTNAALEVIVISGTLNNPVTTHYAYDPCAVSRRPGNNFWTPTSGTFSVDGKSYKDSTGLISIADGLLIRVIPLYYSTKIAVKVNAPSPALPVQGSIIASTGTSGQTTRKLSFYKGFSEVPAEFFQYTILSP